MKFDDKVHSTTVTQIKHTKENQIRTNLEWFLCRLGIQKCKMEKGKRAKGQRDSFRWVMRFRVDLLAKLSIRLDQWFMCKECSTT